MANGFLMTANRWAGIRRTCFRALGALGLMCASIATASASPQTAPSAKPHRKTATTSSAKKKSTTHSAVKSGTKSVGITRKASAKTKLSTSRRKRKSARTRGQQKIDSERAQSIQEALIREHYLTGEATGTWNQASEDAMRRYQSDHGWQSKTVPDARALIKLGLGPSHDHLLNPESAMTTGPDMPRAASLSPVSHSADPAAGSSKPSSASPTPASNADHDSPSPR
jgi:hypothetical protein